MRQAMPSIDWRVSEVIERCPQSVSVFMRLGMACVGCPMASFETLDEAADAYGLNPTRLLHEFHTIPRPGEKQIERRNDYE